MLVVKLAFKNLFRYKKRTLITAIAIAFGLAFYLFIDSLLTGWYSGAERGYINYEVASGRIVKESWWEEKERLPLSESIEETGAITSLLDELGIAYTPRTEFAADLVFYEDPYPQSGVYPVKVVAIDPARDADIFDLAESIHREGSRGEFLSSESDGIVVGNALADKLDMEVGYPVRLQFSGKMGYEEILDTRIIGIVKSGSNMVNVFGVFISMDTAEYYLQMDGSVTAYAIEVSAGKRGDAQLEELRKRLPEEYRLLGYDEIAADFVAMQEMENSFVYVGIFIAFLMAAVGVSNTMMMAIFERRREIGMMRAQGFSDRRIRLMFFLEAAAIGVFGAAAGLVIGALANWPLVEIGFDYGSLLQTYGDVVEFGGFVIDASLKGVWSAKSFLIGALFAIVISTLVAFFPIHRMLKKSIPDNLRME